jgi:hypothetical protein
MRWKVAAFVASLVASFSLGAASLSLASQNRAPQPVTLASAQFNALMAQLRAANLTLGARGSFNDGSVSGELKSICEAVSAQSNSTIFC